ncbi:HNH endonuclease signature motif containing protein [Nocardioides mesophilus]|uniref:HNH endonuclease signature motif containing protein n=1 Tax=Nocardioides mesophilus TaxID=433659 RepID=UPI001CB73181|nr:HNH endonuclease signature motif containing protein [Nocardioides mesophilus]
MAADLEDVRAWVGTLADLGGGLGDAERVDLIRALEELKGAAAAAQARVSCEFDASQREAQRAAGVPERRVGQGVAAQVALARRDSPHRGDQHLGTAKALVREMPHTLGLLTRGVLSERRATLLVRETAYLAREHRAVIDAELAGPGAVEAVAELSDRALVAAAQRIAYRLDPHAVTDRARRAASQRSVTLRPAPDTMSYLTGLLPVAQGVACYAVLTRAADTARAAGDPRTRGQVMADTLVAALGARATHPTPAAGPAPSPGSAAAPGSGSGSSARATQPAPAADAGTAAESQPDPRPATVSPTPDPAGPAGSISLQLVMTDRTLLRGDDEPAHLVGYGTVPAGWARDLLRSTGAEVFLRRLYTSPSSGRLLAADAKARRFTGALREVLIARDQRCRTPWCDAPVRHLDHARPWESGGTTSTVNGQGQCEKCNYAKQAPGWTADGTAPPGDRHSVHTTTPTGHRYRSRAPAPPGTPALAPRRSRAELHFSDIVLAS